MPIMINGGGGLGDFSPAGPAPGPGDESWGGYVPDDPSAATPASIKPLVDTFESIAAVRPGPDGKGGLVPEDPIFSLNASYNAPDQPSPTTLSAGVTERVGQLACYQFHYFDLVCGGVTTEFAGGVGYFIGTNKGSNFPCADDTNVGVIHPGAIPGTGDAGCYSVFTSPGGPSCNPECTSPDVPKGDNTPFSTGPTFIATATQQGPRVNQIVPKQGTTGELDYEMTLSGSGTTITGIVSGGGGALTPQITDTHFVLTAKKPTGEINPIVSIPLGENGQPGSLGPGDPTGNCCNSDTAPVISSFRTRPTDGGASWTYYPTPDSAIITTAIECTPCGDNTILQPRVGAGPPSNSNPPPAQNNPKPPQPTQDNSKAKPSQPPKTPGAGINGKIQQLIIIQDDSSQHYVQVIGTNG